MRYRIHLLFAPLILLFSFTAISASTADNACVILDRESGITPTAFMRSGVESVDHRFDNPKLFFVSLPDQIKPHGEKVFIFSPKHLRWAAYDRHGNLVNEGKANGGSHWCRDVGRPCRTPRGVFRVHTKGSSYCRSSKYPRPRGGAPMPYCMYFKGGYAIHGSPQIGNRNSSHGCIRVKTDKARWLSENFITKGTKVIVWSY